jgi:small subunit ribosomal protein S17
LVHDENEDCVVGDYVKIDACEKISKRKHFTLAEIVKPAQRVLDSQGRLITQPIEVKSLPKEYNIDQYK